MSSLVSSLLSALGRSPAAQRAAVPYSEAAKALVAATFGATTIGFVRPIWFISVGYGLAMIAQTAVAFRALTAAGSSPLSPVQRLGLAASALHGLWMAAFLLARDTVLETYRHKKLALDRKTKSLSLANRLVMWAGVSALYLALFVPTWSLAASPAPAEGLNAARASSAGVAVSLLGLWLEVTADLVKAWDKKRNPAGFSSGCVYRICRQPNLLGEALFWWGTLAAGAPSLLCAAKRGGAGLSGGVAAVVAAGAGTAAITSILVGDSKKKTKDQEARMRGKSGWSAYASKTPPLWPLPRK